jgi:hypothetical protein
MRRVTQADVDTLLPNWSWLVPASHSPLLISVLGDWVFGSPNGQHWALSILEGDYRKVAGSSAEFNASKRSFAWLDEHFQASWQEVGERHGLSPGPHQCLAWRIPPAVGGEFAVSNLQVLPQSTYQHAMAQLHQELKRRVS